MWIILIEWKAEIKWFNNAIDNFLKIFFHFDAYFGKLSHWQLTIFPFLTTNNFSFFIFVPKNFIHFKIFCNWTCDYWIRDKISFKLMYNLFTFDKFLMFKNEKFQFNMCNFAPVKSLFSKLYPQIKRYVANFACWNISRYSMKLLWRFRGDSVHVSF